MLFWYELWPPTLILLVGLVDLPCFSEILSLSLPTISKIAIVEHGKWCQGRAALPPIWLLSGDW